MHLPMSKGGSIGATRVSSGSRCLGERLLHRVLSSVFCSIQYMPRESFSERQPSVSRFRLVNCVQFHLTRGKLLGVEAGNGLTSQADQNVDGMTPTGQHVDGMTPTG